MIFISLADHRDRRKSFLPSHAPLAPLTDTPDSILLAFHFIHESETAVKMPRFTALQSVAVSAKCSVLILSEPVSAMQAFKTHET